MLSVWSRLTPSSLLIYTLEWIEWKWMTLMDNMTVGGRWFKVFSIFKCSEFWFYGFFITRFFFFFFFLLVSLSLLCCPVMIQIIWFIPFFIVSRMRFYFCFATIEWDGISRRRRVDGYRIPQCIKNKNLFFIFFLCVHIFYMTVGIQKCSTYDLNWFILTQKKIFLSL